MLILGGRRALQGHSRPPFSSCLASAYIMKLLGQPSPVWRLVSRLWNLYVKISLCYPKEDFVGRFSFSTLAYCHTRQPSWLKIKTTREARLLVLLHKKRSSMGLSCSQAQTNTQTFLSGKGVVAGSIPVRFVPLFNKEE